MTMKRSLTIGVDDRHFYEGSFPKRWSVIWEQDVTHFAKTHVTSKKIKTPYRIVFCCPSYEPNHGSGYDLGGKLMLQKAFPPPREGEEPVFSTVRDCDVDLREVDPDEWSSVIVEKANHLINWAENWLDPSWRMHKALDEAAMALDERIVEAPDDGAPGSYHRFIGKEEESPLEDGGDRVE